MGSKKFINYKNGRYLYTDDNWKTISITEDQNAPTGYKKETNNNRNYEAKLKYEYGLRLSSFVIKELKHIGIIRQDKTGLSFNKNGGYGDEFEVLAISLLHNLSYEDVIDNNIVVGDNDGKIDAVYCDNKTGICYIYQIKINDVNDDVLDRMKKNIDLYRNKKLNTAPNCSDLLAFLDNKANKIFDYRLKYYTISKNSRLSSNIDSSRIINDFIAKKVLLSSQNKELRITTQKSVSEIKTYASLKNDKIIFLFANAKTLIDDLINCYGEEDLEQVFSNNVRGFVGENNEMIETIKNEPELFCSYNNGISITGDCEIDNTEGTYFVSVKNVSIINGQQTITNIYQCYKDGVDIRKINLPVFIKKYSTNKEQSRIARFNNTQKSVSPIDLLSLDANVRQLQKDLLIPESDDYGTGAFYLNIISSGDKAILKNARKAFGSTNIVKLSDFVKLYSVIRNPSMIGPWKNSVSEQIKENYNDGFPSCSKQLARKICSCILRSKVIISSNRTNYAIADLPIQYLLYLGMDDDKAKETIDKTTRRFLSSHKNKAADVYKSKKAYDHIVSCLPKGFKPKG